MNSDFDKNLTYFENNLNSDDIPTVFIHGVGLNSSMWGPQKSYFKYKNVIITLSSAKKLQERILNEKN